MSKMSELSLDIQFMLEQNRSPEEIARILDIPVYWVHEAMELDAEFEFVTE